MHNDPLSTHTDDTNPMRPISARDLRRSMPIPAWRRAIGGLSLIGAIGLTMATAAVLFTMPPEIPPDEPIATATGELIAATQTTLPSQPTTQPDDDPVRPIQEYLILPTLDPAQFGQILNAPLISYSDAADAQDIAISRDTFDPFTFVPDRPRSDVIQYTVQSGDTIFGIAERFGLQPDSIAWSNDRGIIGGLRPGRAINIPPADGAYAQMLIDTPIDEVARRYGVESFVIIEAEINNLYGSTGSTVLSPGTWVFIPGGIGEQIAWTAPVQRTGSESGGAGAQISFGAGEPGSCGLQDNPGGGTGWVRPLSGYTWTRGFTSYHTGVDLAAPTGTPIVAANSGTVIFAGGSSYGYGIAIVLAHGPYTTVYGHLSSLSVNCGQYVNAGQVIGAVGSTGQSSGPHLHFEIRLYDVPTDPTGTMPF